MYKRQELQYKNSSIAVEPPDGKGFLEGYASVYGVVDRQNERTMPGAFESALKSPRRLKLLWQHKFEQPIGKITKLWEDERGLRFRAKLNLKTDWGRNAYEALLADDVNANSIGYQLVAGKNAVADDGVTDLNAVELHEISVVSFPSNEAATVDEVKSDVHHGDVDALTDKDIADIIATGKTSEETKAGRMLSNVNAQDITALRANLATAIEYCDAVLGRAVPPKEEVAPVAAAPKAPAAPAAKPAKQVGTNDLLINKLKQLTKEITI